MKIALSRVEQLPRLAWCAKVPSFSEVVEVVHGPWVETTDTSFYDGAWSSEFSSGHFETSILAGTAGKVTDEGLLVATPNNTLERILVLQVEDAVMVSNSLAFLLAAAHDDVDTRYLFYDSKFASIVEGLKKCVRSIRTRNGRQVLLFYHCNVLITPDLQVIETPKKPVRDFAGFADHKSFLEETVMAIQDNASDQQRRIKYAPITTISSGYDSPATAVLARKAGCDEALTFRRSRGRRNASGGDDSGERLASILGMRVTTFDRLDYLREPGFTEIENSGYPLVFAAWGKVLERRVLFTGFHGDKVWDRNPLVVSPYIIRGDSSGSGMIEFRLRIGFIHVAVPFLGCTSHPSIHRISNSPEMEPWSLKNDYDRPIPRRLVEEAGIPRELFGFAKRAVDVVLGDEGEKAMMNQESWQDFDRFCVQNWSPWMQLKAKVVGLAAHVNKLNQAINQRAVVFLKRRLGINVELPRFVPRPLRVLTHGSMGRRSLLFHWAIRKLLTRYTLGQSATSAKADYRVSIFRRQAPVVKVTGQVRRLSG